MDVTQLISQVESMLKDATDMIDRWTRLQTSLLDTLNGLKAYQASLPAPWPINAPDVFSLDLKDYNSVMAADFLDGTISYSATSRVIHYGDMSGPPTPLPGQPTDWSGKFSNATFPPRFGYDPIAQLSYLENGTDGSKEPQPKASGSCATCRINLWQFRWLPPRAEYFFRTCLWVSRQTLDNQTELGIKLMGFGHLAYNISQILELGPKTATGWPLQTYCYDGEGVQRIDRMPDCPEIKPETWYVLEGHVKANTFSTVNGLYQANADGVLEFKVNGKLVFSRTNVKTFDITRPGPFTTFYAQKYHGGTNNAKGPLVFREAAIAVSKTNWIGPPPQMKV